ncbi:DUF2441 domain-containing protein [Gordonibacter urolithinfaciens]|uniref:DUF2441 domain-containing protein n=1 Tax=Gordonibacter urolithinfaciens TaxID=1335613 RepID=UPI0036F27270
MLYHLDRSGSLSEGATIELAKPESDDQLLAIGAVEEVSRMFPDGVSRHGMEYLTTVSVRVFQAPSFLLGSLQVAMSTAIIEQTFELVRRADFPEMPSRLQSLFCVKDPSDFAAWPELNAQGGTLFEIVPENQNRVVKLDASFLQGGFIQVIGDDFVDERYSFPMCSSFAYRYWSGEVSESPKPEVLVELPATSLRKVCPGPPTPVPASATLDPHRWQ